MGMRTWKDPAMTNIDDRIASLEAKLKQEKARKQKMEARRRAFESKKKRREDTRRKILVGAVVFEMIKNKEFTEEKLLAILDRNLVRKMDRDLFFLP